MTPSTSHMPFGPSLSAPLACRVLTMVTTVHGELTLSCSLAPNHLDAGSRPPGLAAGGPLGGGIRCPESFAPPDYSDRTSR
jgi:hypothetical protein